MNGMEANKEKAIIFFIITDGVSVKFFLKIRLKKGA